MANVILLEDEAALREDVAELLELHGHRVDVAASVADFMRVFKPELHQVAVVDLGLPDGDGLDVIFQMRRDGLRLGIIILTARAGKQVRVDGLNRGADYYISKTADLVELSATITSLGRRMKLDAKPGWLLQASPRQLVSPGGMPIPLSAQDYLVLRTIMQAEESVSREHIIHALGSNVDDYDQRRLYTQIGRLRRKVREVSGLDLPITTLRGLGFSFGAPSSIQA